MIEELLDFGIGQYEEKYADKHLAGPAGAASGADRGVVRRCDKPRAQIPAKYV